MASLGESGNYNDEDEVHYFNACTSRNAYPYRHTCRKPQPCLVPHAERASTVSPFSYMPDDDNASSTLYALYCIHGRSHLESPSSCLSSVPTIDLRTKRSFPWLPSTNKLMAQKVALICANAVKPIASYSQRKHVSECLGATLGYRRSLSSARLINGTVNCPRRGTGSNEPIQHPMAFVRMLPGVALG